MNMTSINIISSMIFIACSICIGVPSILSWKKAKSNHEFVFNFGLSFLILGFVFSIYLLSEYIDLSNFVITVHLLDTVIFIKQVQAIEYIMSDCDNPYNRKGFRLFGNVFVIIVICILGCLIYGYGLSGDNGGMVGLQVIGFLPLDLFFEIFHISMAFYIFYRLDAHFTYLKIGFLSIAISEIFQMINIIMYGYTDSLLYLSEWVTASLGIILMFIATVLVIWRERRER